MKIDGGLRQLYRKHLPDFHWQAIETFVTGAGVPDANGCIDGIEIWIENKFAKGHRRVAFAPAQIGWIEQRLRHGGKVFIAVRHVTSKSDTLYLLRGFVVRELVAGQTPDTIAIGTWEGGPQNWDWGAVKQLLCNSKD